MPELNAATSPMSIPDEQQGRPRECSTSSGSTKSPENSVSNRQPNSYSSAGNRTTSDPNLHRRHNRHRQLKAVGPYILGKTLGKGQTGLVKLATHCKTKKRVAIKIIDRSNVKESVVRKVEREIVVMKLIQHPHLLRLYDVYDNTKFLFLVLEYVEGGELFDYLVKRGRLVPNEARRIFRQIVSAISYCHDHCVCHRDLKPENLLLDSSNDIRVADFGMANLQIEVMRTSCGSPHYAAPEVIMGEHYDGFKADVWSCGVILYALLAGQLPFDDPNLPNLLEKVKYGHFVMPVYFPPKAQRLIHRMLERDPKRRISLKTVLEDDWVMGTNRDGSDAAESPSPTIETIEAVQTYPLESTEHIDRDILKNMLSFTCFKDKAELIAALLSQERNMEKAVYFLLLRRKDENPAVSDDSDIEEINIGHNGWKFETTKRVDSFPLEARSSSFSALAGPAMSPTQANGMERKIPEMAITKIGDQIRQRTHSDCSPLLKAKTQQALRVTPLPHAGNRRDSSPSAVSFSSLPGSPRESPRASPRSGRRPSGSLPPPLSLPSERLQRLSMGTTPSPPPSLPVSGVNSVAACSPLVSPPTSPLHNSPGLLRRLSQAFLGTPQFHRRNMDSIEANSLERNSLEMPSTPTAIKRSWFTHAIDNDEICFLVDRKDLATLRTDINAVLKLLEVDIDTGACTPTTIRCEFNYERKYMLTKHKRMVFVLEITAVDQDVKMKYSTSYTITGRKVSGSIRRFRTVCERLQGFLLARPSTSPDVISDDEVLRDETSPPPPPVTGDTDSAYQSTASPDQSSELVSESAFEPATDDQPPVDGKVPKRKLSKRKNFTRSYPKSESGGAASETATDTVADSTPAQVEA